MKHSVQRKTILEIVNNSYDHPTAEMVYEKTKQKIPNISLGTVYRNLNLLSELKLIKKIVINNKSCIFDKIYPNHSHLHCNICNKTVDITIDYKQKIFKTIEQTYNYKLLSSDIVLNGMCHDCQQKEEEKQ